MNSNNIIRFPSPRFETEQGRTDADWDEDIKTLSPYEREDVLRRMKDDMLRRLMESDDSTYALYGKRSDEEE